MSVAAMDNAAVQRVLSTKHAKLLLRESAGPSGCPSGLADEIRRRGLGRGRRLARLACKAALVLALLHASSALLFGQCPALWQLLQNSEAFSRAEFQYNHLLRRVTVSLGLHNHELLHARERDRCLVLNPLYRRPLRCCPCDRHQLVAFGSAARIRARYDGLFDRMVRPFAYGNSSQPPVTFPELRAAVSASWVAVERGSNRLRQLWPAAADTEWSLDRLFQGDAPPAGRAVAWLFGHLPAIRALRRLTRRPDHLPDLAEDILARQFVFLGAGLPTGDWIPLGDMGIVKGLAYAYSLHGEASVSLALKSECCPAEVAVPGYRNRTRRLGRGDVLSFQTDCYWVSVAKLNPESDYAIVYFGSVYNGIHPIDTESAKRPKTA